MLSNTTWPQANQKESQHETVWKKEPCSSREVLILTQVKLVSNCHSYCTFLWRSWWRNPIRIKYLSHHINPFFPSQVDYRAKAWICNFCFNRNAVSISLWYSLVVCTHLYYCTGCPKKCSYLKITKIWLHISRSVSFFFCQVDQRPYYFTRYTAAALVIGFKMSKLALFTAAWFKHAAKSIHYDYQIDSCLYNMLLVFFINVRKKRKLTF